MLVVVLDQQKPWTPSKYTRYTVFMLSLAPEVIMWLTSMPFYMNNANGWTRGYQLYSIIIVKKEHETWNFSEV